MKAAAEDIIWEVSKPQKDISQEIVKLQEMINRKEAGDGKVKREHESLQDNDSEMVYNYTS